MKLLIHLIATAKVTFKPAIIALLLLSAQGCALLKTNKSPKAFARKVHKIGTFKEHFSGMAFYDPETENWLYRQNADKYFTPASNTKLLTYFGALKTLDKRLDALQYLIRNDTLYFGGTGDPTFLHPDFDQQPVLNFLSSDTTLTLVYIARPVNNRFGPGWAWDDYLYDFQPELSDLPMWGNVVSFEKTDTTFEANPAFFEPFVEIQNGKSHSREVDFNLFQLGSESESESFSIPYITSPQLTTQLLSFATGRKVYRQDSFPEGKLQLLPGIRASTLYLIMMLRSDNFYAEQINLMGSFKLGYGWNTAAFRDHVIKTNLSDLPQKIVWRDGSGLSRYNLVTPESMVNLLAKIEAEAGFEQIKNTFPVGGKSGTLRKWYAGDAPYIYAKTGTLSNNHNLSGFLITKSGRKLIFSLMNNNYVRSNSEIKASMQQLLEYVRDHY